MKKDTKHLLKNKSSYKELLETIDQDMQETPIDSVANSDLSTDVLVTDYPMLLFPVRIETRFLQSELLIRVFPDDISIESHDEEVKDGEKSLYLQLQDKGLDEKKIWMQLASAFGTRRATWIIKVMNDSNEEKYESDRENLSMLSSLPDYFVFYLYKEDGTLCKKIKGNPIRKDIAILPAGLIKNPMIQANEDNSVENPFFDKQSKWVYDFPEAINSGMAVQIRLDDSDKVFSKIVVTGIKRESCLDSTKKIKKIINAHRYNDGFAFLPYDTQTNNTPESKTSFTNLLDEDLEVAYTREMVGHRDWEEIPDMLRTNTERLGNALGLGTRPEVLRYIANNDSKNDSYANALHAVLWPSTGDYYLRNLMKGVVSNQNLSFTYRHFTDYVRGCGFLPALCVGNQPYGILPVTKVNNYEVSELLSDNGEKEFETKLLRLLLKLKEKWLKQASSSALPRIATETYTDADLMQILTMMPFSEKIGFSRAVNKKFLSLQAAIAAYKIVGVNNLIEFLKQLIGCEVYSKEQIAELEKLTGLSEDLLKKMPILDIVANLSDLENVNNDFFLTKDKDNPEDRPESYLIKLCEFALSEKKNDKLSFTSKTLLFELIKRTIILAKQPGYHSVCNIGYIVNSIDELASYSPLEFFNNVNSPEEIRRRIKDDPEFQKAPPSAYGIGLKKANLILKTRKELGGKFESILQIKNIRGIGKDTFHDILTSFRGIYEEPELDYLFRNAFDVCSHRLDAWISSLAAKRLVSMRAKRPNGIYIGAYGFVENLIRPDVNNTSPVSSGYIHAPSAPQAVTSAVLLNGFNTFKEMNPEFAAIDLDNPYAINLPSSRARQSLELWNSVKDGLSLSYTLGAQFERTLHDKHLDQFIDVFRNYFSFAENQSTEDNNPGTDKDALPRNLVDGLSLARGWQPKNGSINEDTSDNLKYLAEKVDDLLKKPECKEKIKEIEQALDLLVSGMDALGDLGITETVYQSIRGNFERAGATLKAVAGAGAPPEIESLDTPVSGTSFEHRVFIAFNEKDSFDESEDMDFKGMAEPRLSKWYRETLGDLNQTGCGYTLFDINTESVNTWSKFDTINEETAQRITSFRKGNGNFNNCRELLDFGLIDNTMYGELMKGISVWEAGLSPLDMLYMSSSGNRGGSDAERWLKAIIHNRENVGENQSIYIDMEYLSDFTYSFSEAFELGKTVLNALGGKKYLSPDQMHLAQNSHELSFTEQDVQEMEDRIKATFDQVEKLRKKLQQYPETVTIDDLLQIGKLNIPVAIPDNFDDAAIKERIKLSFEELEKRLKKAGEYQYGKDAEVLDKIENLTKQFKALFGEGFIIMPSFRLEKETSEFEGPAREVSKDRLRLWMRQAAQTHSFLETTEDMLSYVHAWQQPLFNESGLANPLFMTQLSDQKVDFWMGLDDQEKLDHEVDETEERPRSVVSLVSVNADVYANQGQEIAGICIDRWNELIPDKTVDTCVSFQYNAPNTQPPQCLLLAVPGEETKTTGKWNEDDLVEIVQDTMELFKIRTIDPDLLPDLGNLLPAMVLPADLFQTNINE